MADPLPTFAEVVKRIRVGYPDFAYIHVLEPTTHHHTQIKADGEGEIGKASNKLLRDIWGDGVYITNSDFGRDSAIETVEKEGGLVSFARHFISNVSKMILAFYLYQRAGTLTCLNRQPDLPLRLKDNFELAPSNNQTYYTHGPEGYIDYPFARGDVKHNS